MLRSLCPHARLSALFLSFAGLWWLAGCDDAEPAPATIGADASTEGERDASVSLAPPPIDGTGGGSGGGVDVPDVGPVWDSGGPPPGCGGGCPPGFVCDEAGDRCVVAPESDKPVGQACAQPQDCPEGACITEDASAGRYPGGLCAQDCQGPADCPSNAVCYAGDGHDGRRACMPRCDAARPCRNGWLCDASVGVCRPDCREAMGCLPGFRCVFESGRCVEDDCQPIAEVCDGSDQDCDGTVDEEALCGLGELCRGGACVNENGEQCNGRDDDNDGRTDEDVGEVGTPCNTGLPGACAAGRVACDFGFSSCAPEGLPGGEVCNGEDDDCDGTIDNGPLCADGEFCRAGACGPAPPGATCGNVLEAAVGENRGATDGTSRDRGSCGGGGDERILRFTAPEAGRWTISTAGSDFDTVLYVRSACADPASELACNDDGGPGTTSEVTVPLQAGAPVFVFVDGFRGVGQWVVTISAAAAIPDECDGVDDDADGTVDEDPGCAEGSVCTDGRCREAGAVCDAEGALRLVDGPNERQGRVEICHDGEWGTICDDGWGDAEARVVCTNLGFEDAEARGVGGASFGQGSGPIWLDQVDCFGGEQDLHNGCDNDGWGVHNCTHREDAGVICAAAETCNGLDDDADGTVDEGDAICPEGERCREGACMAPPPGEGCDDPQAWAPPGDEGIGGETDAANASQTRGSCGGNGVEHVIRFRAPAAGTWTFDTSGSAYDTVIYVRSACGNSNTQLACDDDGGAGNTSRVSVDLDAGEEVFVFVDAFRIGSGGAWSLRATGAIAGAEMCNDADDDRDGATDEEPFLCGVGQYCAEGACSLVDDPCGDEGAVRLVNGDNPLEGRVEICRDGQWGTVCNRGWGSDDARVVCRQLGYPTQTVFSFATFGQGAGPIWLSNINCGGDEARLDACGADDWGRNGCGHFQDAGVECRGPEVCNGLDDDHDGRVDDGELCEVGERCSQGACVALPPGGVCARIIDGGAGETQGNTGGLQSETFGSCAGARGGEEAVRFQAQAAGRYRLETTAAEYDTVLYVRRVCADPESELGCNDDGGAGLLSRLEVELAAFETVFVFVDGINGGGAWTLEATFLGP